MTETGREYKDVEQRLEGIREEENKKSQTACCLHMYTVQTLRSIKSVGVHEYSLLIMLQLPLQY